MAFRDDQRSKGDLAALAVRSSGKTPASTQDRLLPELTMTPFARPRARSHPAPNAKMQGRLLHRLTRSTTSIPKPASTDRGPDGEQRRGAYPQGPVVLRNSRSRPRRRRDSADSGAKQPRRLRKVRRRLPGHRLRLMRRRLAARLQGNSGSRSRLRSEGRLLEQPHLRYFHVPAEGHRVPATPRAA